MSRSLSRQGAENSGCSKTGTDPTGTRTYPIKTKCIPFYLIFCWVHQRLRLASPERAERRID